MHAEEIVKRYATQVTVFKHKAILINVNRTATERSLYDSTRYAWKVNVAVAKDAQVILANRLGIIAGAFVAEKRLDAIDLSPEIAEIRSSIFFFFNQS